jgi:hypothetical protein
MKKGVKKRNQPVASLAYGSQKLVRVQEHDLVLIGLLHHDALHLGCIGHYQCEVLARNAEETLH